MITVKGRTLIIPEIERQIGTQYDSNSETRQIKINRLTPGGIDLSNLDFHLDLRYGKDTKDTAILSKEITEDAIILTWTVSAASVAQIGTVWIAVRGSDDFGTVKWATNEGHLYVGKTRYDTNETLFTLMLNYIALNVIVFLREGAWRDPGSQGYAKIARFNKNAALDKVFGIQFGWVIALILVVVIAVYLNRSKQGYEISVVGESQETARYAGMNVKV